MSSLHATAFSAEPSPPASFFVDVYLRNPWFDPEIPALVHVEDGGEITGFLGIVARDLSYGDFTGRAAIACQFMVAETKRSSMAALRLLKEHLAGPQLISIADSANDSGRSIWSVLGAEVAPVYSFTWSKKLRVMPASRLVRRISRATGNKRLRHVTAPFASGLDKLLMSAVRSARRGPPSPKMTLQDVGASEIAALSQNFSGHLLTFDYETGALRWLLEHARPVYNGPRDLRAKAVYDPQGQPAGLFVYFLDVATGRARVLHVASASGRQSEVFEALIWAAWNDGAESVGGRMNPQLNVSLATDRSLEFFHHPLWTVVHSKEPVLLSAIQRGDFVLSQLECEWACGYRR